MALIRQCNQARERERVREKEREHTRCRENIRGKKGTLIINGDFADKTQHAIT